MLQLPTVRCYVDPLVQQDLSHPALPPQSKLCIQRRLLLPVGQTTHALPGKGQELQGKGQTTLEQTPRERPGRVRQPTSCQDRVRQSASCQARGTICSARIRQPWGRHPTRVQARVRQPTSCRDRVRQPLIRKPARCQSTDQRIERARPCPGNWWLSDPCLDACGVSAPGLSDPCLADCGLSDPCYN